MNWFGVVSAAIVIRYSTLKSAFIPENAKRILKYGCDESSPYQF